MLAAALVLSLAPPTPLDLPSRPGALAPRLLVQDDAVHLTWLEPSDARAGHRFRISTRRDESWSAPVTIVEGVEFFANWADTPSVALAGDDALIAHWPQKSGPGTYSYDVVMSRSEDGGMTWTQLGRPHRDGTQTEHGFVSMVPTELGVAAFWLDGRDMAPGEHGHDHAEGEMTLRVADVSRGFGDSVRLDSRVCECCNTDAAMTSSGPIVVYRDRGEHETRDISIVRRAGDLWTEPKPVADDGWRINGCPVNGPAVAARGDDVVVCWFTGATERGTVRVAFSGDGGATFAAPIDLDDSYPIGRVDVALLDDGRALVLWLDEDGETNETSVVLQRVAPGGAAGEPHIVAIASSSRSTGFPRMAIAGGEVIVVWTHANERRTTSLRAATVSLDRLIR